MRANHRALLALGIALIALLAVAIEPATASTPPTTTPSGLRACPMSSATISSACLSGALSDFNRARAKEGLHRLILPSNFRSLTVAEQLLVLTNLDRVARHLQPFTGLNSTLDKYAAAGASTRRDPRFPSWTRQGRANWASTYNPLWSEFLWMYYDGGAGWVHRHNILTAFGSPRVMGAAGYPKTGDATLYMGYDGHDATYVFRWSSEARYFPGGVLPRP
ncbi:MAG: hypothetical protein ACTHJM_10295 [Marmoricola sp.]